MFFFNPVEEQGVRGCHAVSGFGLLDGQAVEGALGIVHEAETGAGLRVVVVAALERIGRAGAAVQADGEELVLGWRGLVGVDDGSNAERVEVLEAHGLGGVEGGAFGEIHATGIHELLTLGGGDVDIGVDVQIVDLVVGLHVVPEVHVSEDGSGSHGDLKAFY